MGMLLNRKDGCMGRGFGLSGSDGSHWGVSDWYPEVEAALVSQLALGPDVRWDSGWWTSKKALASARIEAHGDGFLHINVVVFDDFDDEGDGHVCISWTADLGVTRWILDVAWAAARTSLAARACYVGYMVINRRGMWVDTILVPSGEGHRMAKPPTDCYHKWGWQGDGPVPLRVRKSFNRAIRHGADSAKSHGYCLRTWPTD